MPLTKLQFRPGINRDSTSYTNEGGWVDCDKVRFRNGFPETIGGWEKLTVAQTTGVPRALHTWTALDGESFIGVGTNLKAQLLNGTQLFDITPIRLTTIVQEASVFSVTGTQGEGQVGSVTLTLGAAADAPVTGVAGTASPSSVQVSVSTSSDATVSVFGVSGAAPVGDLAPNFAVLSGISAAGAVGDVEAVDSSVAEVTGTALAATLGRATVLVEGVASQISFVPTVGSSIVEVQHLAHGALVNDYVTFSDAASLGGAITASTLNGETQVVSVLSSSSYTIDVGVVATAADTAGGGANTVAAYQINTGLDTSIQGAGWGADPWSAGGWGLAANTTIPGAQLRLWGMDNYGEDFFFNVRNGGAYYWDRTAGTGVRAVALSDLAGANKAPTIARQVMTSDRDRHAMAFGCDDEFTPGVQDPLLIRFSDQENVADWEAREDNTAGSLRISSGSEIIAAVKTRQQILVFTDISLHVMQYIGAPFTFGLNEISAGITIASPNAAVAVNDEVFWMGEGSFYRYRGTVQQLPCTVREFVFSGLNTSQASKVSAGHNSEHGEVWWFYPSTDSDTNDRYVVYNYAENVWYYGSLARTAWQQRGVFGFSIAASPDGYLYYHETGLNDGSQNPPVGIDAYIESSPIDMGEGDRFMFASRVIPDLTFRSSEGTPAATFTFKAQDWPGDGFIPKEEADAIARTQSVPVEKWTREQYIRLRGRAMALRVSSDQYNTAWRLGTPRIDVRPDGRR